MSNPLRRRPGWRLRLPMRWSIGGRLLSITGALILMVGLLGANEFVRALSRQQDIVKLREASETTGALFAASAALAFERDVALTAMRRDGAGDQPGLQQTLAEAQGRSRLAASAMDAALARWRDGGVWRQRLRAHLARIEDLRAGLAHGRDVAAPWRDEVKATLADIDRLWIEIVRPLSGVDAVITQHLHFKRLLAAIYDQSGQERAVIATALSDNHALRPAELARLNQLRGGLDISWTNLRALAVQGGFIAALDGPFSDAFSQDQALNGMLDDALSGGTSVLPISPTLWLELSDQHQEALDGLRAASLSSAAADLQRLKHAALKTALFRASMLAGMGLLCALCFVVLSRTVIRPIKRIVTALGAAARGEAVALDVTSAHAHDEIGQLVEVLHVLQQRMEMLRETAAKLDAGERRLRAVVDNAIDGLITINETGCIQTFNPACERLFGYQADAIIGAPASAIMPALFGGRVESLAGKRPADGASFAADQALETFARAKSGALIPIEITLSEVNLAETSLLSAIVRNITPRKQAEAALKSHAEALERSNKELDDFAYIASHDLKEPLRGLHNHARFLLEDNGAKLDGESVRRLNRLVALTQRMERLVNDLLYFSRLGRQDLAIHAVDLNHVVGDIEGTLDHFLAEHGARIVIPAKLPTVICDAPRVSELFRNLITNAVKYNDKASDKWVEIGVCETRSAASGRRLSEVFYVKDNGCGIAPEFHQEVFRIFKRLKADTGADGTGVGLTFVKKIVERHGGEIWVESTPGEGATFFFTLKDQAHEHVSAAA